MYNKTKRIAEAGFTLVELSIVIVIIGFLVAGIAAGANMVKQAQIRSVISDLQSFQTSYNGFVGRYNKVPGDLDTGSSYWPAAGSTPCAVTDANCNGDGDGIIEPLTTAAADEASKAWKHLQLAGFIGSGISVIPNTLVLFTPGVNAPASKISGAAFFFAGTNALTRGAGAATLGFGASTVNYVYLGKNPATTATILNLTGGSLKPEDAFNVDTKLDDGVVSGTNFTGFNSGNIRAILGTDGTTSSCVNAGNTSYVVATTETSCLLGMAVN